MSEITIPLNEDEIRELYYIGENGLDQFDRVIPDSSNIICYGEQIRKAIIEKNTVDLVQYLKRTAPRSEYGGEGLLTTYCKYALSDPPDSSFMYKIDEKEGELFKILIYFVFNLKVVSVEIPSKCFQYRLTPLIVSSGVLSTKEGRELLFKSINPIKYRSQMDVLIPYNRHIHPNIFLPATQLGCIHSTFQIRFDKNIYLTDADNRTLLWHSRHSLQSCYIKSLLRKGIDPNHRDCDGETVMFSCVRTNTFSVAEILCEHGQIDLDIVSNEGKTVFDLLPESLDPSIPQSKIGELLSNYNVKKVKRPKGAK